MLIWLIRKRASPIWQLRIALTVDGGGGRRRNDAQGMNSKASRSPSAVGDSPLAARLLATVAGWHLDGALAAGVDPAAGLVLAARAARL
ncbi:MAG TPA: hypothetical protein VF526_06185 [Solirubrobacteraceae bacterium]